MRQEKRETEREPIRVLLVEDEAHLREMIAAYLRQRGCAVRCAADGDAGYALCREQTFDVFVLDVMLPGMDGFALLSRLRQEGERTPALFLTARTQLDDRMQGFRSGAQDYLGKPFALEELWARIEVLVLGSYQEGAGSRPGVICFADLSLDSGSLLLSGGERERSVKLSAREGALLEYLMRNAGQILSKEQITVRVWGYESDAEYNQEEVYISFLRKKLRFLGTRAVIRTVRGAGYVLEEKA